MLHGTPDRPDGVTAAGPPGCVWGGARPARCGGGPLSPSIERRRPRSSADAVGRGGDRAIVRILANEYRRNVVQWWIFRRGVPLHPRTISPRRADTALALADVLEAAGRAPDAVTFLRQAIELYDRKGHVIGHEKARERLAKLERDPEVAQAAGGHSTQSE